MNRYRTRIATGYKPHMFQKQIHRGLKRFNVLVCHRRLGKTFLAINSLVDGGIRCEKTDPHFAYVAPHFNQAKSVAWNYLQRFALRVPGAKANQSELSITYGHNNAKLRLFGANNPDSLRGLYFDGIILDEPADMKPEVWGEVIRPALADRKGWATFIGTPKGFNFFHDLYQTAITNPAWFAACIPVTDTVGKPGILIDHEELALARETMTDNQYRQEFLCDFTASCDNTLIAIDLITAATARFILESDYNLMPKVLGVDVARYGDDRSVIQSRQGLAAFEPQIYKGMDNMWLAGQVARTIDSFQPDAVFIDAGRGEGVIDRLRQLGYTNIIEVNFGGRATKNHLYANKRTEMWFNMQEWFVAGGCIPNNKELVQSLVLPTYHFDAANKHILEKKEDMKERAGFSPDPGDALALTFAAPVNRGIIVPGRSGDGTDTYDPLTYR